MNASGTVQWTMNGVPICTAADDQDALTLVSDAAGGAIIAWQDRRGGKDYDIYVQRIGSGGSIPSSVQDGLSPTGISLSPNFPNPFSRTTWMDLQTPAGSNIEVEVYDVMGRAVRRTVGKNMSAGSRRLTFDGLDVRGRPLPSGVYLYRVNANGTSVTRKILLSR